MIDPNTLDQHGQRMHCIEAGVALAISLAELEPGLQRDAYLTVEEIAANVRGIADELTSDGIKSTPTQVAMDCALAAEALARMYRDIAATVTS